MVALAGERERSAPPMRPSAKVMLKDTASVLHAPYSASMRMLARTPGQARGYLAARSLPGTERILGFEPADSATRCTSGWWGRHARRRDSICASGTPKARTGYAGRATERQSLARPRARALAAPLPLVCTRMPHLAYAASRGAESEKLKEIKRTACAAKHTPKTTARPRAFTGPIRIHCGGASGEAACRPAAKSCV